MPDRGWSINLKIGRNLSVEIGGEARAYPLRVMIWHEIVNDKVAEHPSR